MAFLRCLIGALALLLSSTSAQQVAWSILDTSGSAAAPWDDAAVEKCKFEELRFRVDAVISAASLAPHRQPYNSEGLHIPFKIVRVNGPVSDGDDRVVHVANLAVQAERMVDTNTDSDAQTDRPPPPIECAFDAAFCIPKIIGIRLPDVVGVDQTLSANHSIILQFADATNRPDAATKHAIDAFVAFPAYVGDKLKGQWTDDKTLEVVVETIDDALVLPQEELMQALVHTTLRVDDSIRNPDNLLVHIHGDMRLRIEPLGDFTLQLVLGGDGAENGAIDLESPLFRVQSCGEPTDSTTILVLSDETHASSVVSHSEPTETPPLPTPSVFIDGVLSHSGREAFTLRHSLIAMEDPGSWSLNFWLLTNQDATGEFRTLFFHGDGDGQHRTPSAWLRPHDRRLALRVSTVDSMDVGLDSFSEIPLNEWVNIGLSFHNCSTGMEPHSTVRAECAEGEPKLKPWFYSMKLFINGALDQDVRMFAPALPNSGPLHLAKGPWTDGLSGFTSQIRVYDHVVSAATHQMLYSRGRRTLYKSLSTKEACDALDSPHSSDSDSIRHPAQQITYWVQCLPLASVDREESGAGVASRPTGGEGTQSIYDEAVRRLEACDNSAFDLLLEASELGDPRALRDLGKALVYGRIALPETCAADKTGGIRVDQNQKRARRLLTQALRSGHWKAARYLALLHMIDRGDTATIKMSAGLYHLAAAAGRADAFMVLGRMYATAESVSVSSTDAAAYHYFHAASDASVAFHARGNQPLHEMDRLYDGLEQEDALRKSQLGDDDERFQYQKMRADKDGDVDAMADMGGLYYWGARGVTRDHVQAASYFRRAAERGHTGAQSALAGMLLKGEGVQQDNASAIEWYEKAARKNHTRALNGLGFIYFHGSGGKAQNKTLALALFERAAANLEDGDSVFNAGYCHALGLGTTRNISRAMQYYDTAVTRFGHFDAAHELGKIHYSGWDAGEASVSRDSVRAIPYLQAAAQAGAWGTCVRVGFELFLAGEYDRAAIQYHEASEYGYAVATSNLAYLYDQKLLQVGNIASESRALQSLRRASERNRDTEVLVRIGDFYYYGLAGVTASSEQALRWYSRASAEGVEAGAYNVGHMHEYGLGVPVNYERAERYYRRVLQLAPPQALDKQIAGQLALIRLRLRRFVTGSPVGRYLIESPSTSVHAAGPQASRTRLPDQDASWLAVSRVVSIVLAVVAVLAGACMLRGQHERTSS